jgi:hypothetical protein
MTKVILKIEVKFDERITDVDSVCVAADTLLETALSTPGILDEHGNPTFDEFLVVRVLPSEGK